MEYLTVIGGAALAHILAVASPGPDFFLVLRDSISHGWRDGVLTSLGIMIGVGCILVFCLTGLSLLLVTRPEWLWGMQLVCGAYLLYLGWKAWPQSTREPTNELPMNSPKASRDGSRPVLEGLFCNLLNPKALLFFFGLFTAVIGETTPTWVKWVCAGEMLLVNFLWFAWLARTLHNEHVRRFWRSQETLILRLMAVMLALLGSLLLWRVAGVS